MGGTSGVRLLLCWQLGIGLAGDFGEREGDRTPLIDIARGSSREHNLKQCQIPPPGLPFSSPHPSLFDAFALRNASAIFLLNAAMHGGAESAKKHGLHALPFLGDIPKGHIKFHCVFPSGGRDTNPAVFSDGDPWMNEIIVVCNISEEDRKVLISTGALAVVLSRKLYGIKHLKSGSEDYPVINLCSSPPPRNNKRHKLSVCTFYNLAADIDRPPEGIDKRLDIDVGLELFANWISFHRLLGFDHFYVYSTVFELLQTPKDEARLEEMKARLNQFAGKFSDYLTLIPWRLPVTNLRNLTSIWGHEFHWVAMAQMPVTDDCLWRFKYNSEWIASFDVDEFLAPNPTLGFSSMQEALSKYSTEPSVVLQTQQFRWSGLNASAFLMDESHQLLSTATTRETAYDVAVTKALFKPQHINLAGVHRPTRFTDHTLIVQPDGFDGALLNHFKWTDVGNRMNKKGYDVPQERFEPGEWRDHVPRVRDCTLQAYVPCVAAVRKKFGRVDDEDRSCVRTRVEELARKSNKKASSP